MTHPLDSAYPPLPIEREYEAWIVRGIEDYFQSLWQRVFIAAVSPQIEVNWPADEALWVNRKLIGLQFKTVSYNGKPPPSSDMGKLTWSFHQPKQQFDTVLRFPEVFYCLPTFINRELSRAALTHCLFWRPEAPEQRYDRNAWYRNRNPKVQTRYNEIGGSRRWGKFLEDVMDCSIGLRVNSVEEAYMYTQKIQGIMIEQESLHRDYRSTSEAQGAPLRVFAIPV